MTLNLSARLSTVAKVVSNCCTSQHLREVIHKSLPPMSFSAVSSIAVEVAINGTISHIGLIAVVVGVGAGVCTAFIERSYRCEPILEQDVKRICNRSLPAIVAVTGNFIGHATVVLAIALLEKGSLTINEFIPPIVGFVSGIASSLVWSSQCGHKLEIIYDVSQDQANMLTQLRIDQAAV